MRQILGLVICAVIIMSCSGGEIASDVIIVNKFGKSQSDVCVAYDASTFGCNVTTTITHYYVLTDDGRKFGINSNQRDLIVIGKRHHVTLRGDNILEILE